MKNKEYLNEEWYQKAKNKVKKVALIILIVGILIGAGLIVAGVITQNNAKKVNEQRKEEALKQSQKEIDEAKKRLSEIATEKDKLNSEIDSKSLECDSLDMNDPSWFVNSNKCDREVSSLRQQLSKLEAEEFKLNNDDYTVYYKPILPIKYLILYYIGASIIGISLIASGVVYFIAMRREVVAFKTQQIMPVAQEGIEKMSPTVGNAAGEIAKGITSGIKEGLNSSEEDK